MKTQDLVNLALKTKETAYAKYSNFKVGCALLDDRDKVFTGSNIENISYGLTICAERNAITTAVSDGAKYLKKVVVSADKDFTTPCGACLQVICEFANEDTMVVLVNSEGKYKEVAFKDFLPLAFNDF